MIIQHNMLAWNANRQYKINNGKIRKTSEKLSSGYKINRAADDAAGLAISEKMRRQIRGLNQAVYNAQDGISLVQSAEGAMQEMHEVVQRGNELAIKAANGTLSDDDRRMIDEEIQQLKDSLNEVAETTVFNEFRLFPEDGQSPKTMVETKNYKVIFNVADQTFSVNDVTAAASGNGGSGGVAGSVLADKIANEYVPNAVKQIMDAFPSLKTKMNGDSVEMELDISYIDGPNNTLAFCQCSFYNSGDPFNFLLKVDSADFSDSDVQGAKAEALESTIAHELMHGVMFKTLTDEMTGRNNGVSAFPDWFVEGTAQLAGGGYTTGWNDALTNITSSLTNENDNSKDNEIADYLNNYTVSGRPYGHGYLAAAYIGYLANGGGTVSASGIAAGMDKIFGEVIGGKSLEQAISDNTGIANEAALENLFSTGDSDLVAFVRKLSKLTDNGAGSVITSNLNVGGTNIVNNASLGNQQFYIDNNSIKLDMESGGKTIRLHTGVEAGVGIDVKLYQMDAEALGLKYTNTKTQTDAGNAITEFKFAIQYINNVRSYYGAIQNRLEHTINNLNNVVENTTAAESGIRDTDMAKTMVEHSNLNILQQAGQAMLAQANHSSDFVLNLLG